MGKTKEVSTGQTRNGKNSSAYVPDTNVFIIDPKGAVKRLQADGRDVVIPWISIMELRGLTNRPDIAYEARTALKTIRAALKNYYPSVSCCRKFSTRFLKDLDRSENDDKIVATAATLLRNHEYEKVTIVTRDETMSMIAEELGVDVMDYPYDKVDTLNISAIKEINVPFDVIDFESLTFPLDDDEYAGIMQNEGVICRSDWRPNGQRGDWAPAFAAIRKGNVFRIIPDDIEAVGIKPYNINGNGSNWSQKIALYQLLDPEIKFVILHGSTGSGKTLLAIAAAIAQRSKYDQIIIMRPMVPVGGKDELGFLPGDKEEKMAPWLRPIQQAFKVIKKRGSCKVDIPDMIEKEKIIFEHIGHVRGMTYNDVFIIVDETQNFDSNSAKSVISRLGEDAKMIFTGDLGQIDHRFINEKTSGLAHAIVHMSDHPELATTFFVDTVRSNVAKLVQERWK
ncbi:MAG: PhoH family protein [Parcubacteria group bacterium]|jgi:PhoH-like ATPase